MNETSSEKTDDERTYTNTSSIHADRGVLNEDQISKILNKAKAESLAKIKNDIDTLIASGADDNILQEKRNIYTSISMASFNINPVKDCPHAYIWVNNSKAMYHILSGRNPDGTDIVVKIIDPEYTPPKGFVFEESCEYEDENDRTDRYLSEHKLFLDTLSKSTIDSVNKDKDNRGMPQLDDYEREKIVNDNEFDYSPRVLTTSTDRMYVDLLPIEITGAQYEAKKKTLIDIATPDPRLYEKGEELEATYHNQNRDDKNYCATIQELSDMNRSHIVKINEELCVVLGISEGTDVIPLEWDDKWDPDNLPNFIPDDYVHLGYVSLKTSASRISAPKGNIDGDVIVCEHVPVEIKVDDFLKKYSSKKNSFKNENGDIYTYPLITEEVIENERSIFGGKVKKVTVGFFDGIDARFALQMIRKYLVDIPPSMVASIQDKRKKGGKYLEGFDFGRTIYNHCTKNITRPHYASSDIAKSLTELLRSETDYGVTEENFNELKTACLNVYLGKHIEVREETKEENGKKGSKVIAYKHLLNFNHRKIGNKNGRGRGRGRGGRGRGRGRGDNRSGNGRGNRGYSNRSRPTPKSLPPIPVSLSTGSQMVNGPFTNSNSSLPPPMGMMDMMSGFSSPKAEVGTKPSSGNSWDKPINGSKMFKDTTNPSFVPQTTVEEEQVNTLVNVPVPMGMISSFFPTESVEKEEKEEIKPPVFKAPKHEGNSWLKPISESKQFIATSSEFVPPKNPPTKLSSPKTNITSFPVLPDFTEDNEYVESLMIGMDMDGLMDSLNEVKDEDNTPVFKAPSPVVKPSPLPPVVNAWSKTRTDALKIKPEVPLPKVTVEPEKPKFKPVNPGQLAFGTFDPVSVSEGPPKDNANIMFHRRNTVNTPRIGKTMSSLPM